MDLNSEIVSCDAQIDLVLRLPDSAATVALLEAYRTTRSKEAFVSALAAKLVLTRATSRSEHWRDGR